MQLKELPLLNRNKKELITTSCEQLSSTEGAPTVTRSLVSLRSSFDLELTYNIGRKKEVGKRHSVSGTTSTVRAYQTDRLGMLSAGTKLYLSTSRLQRERKSYQSYWRRKDWLSALSDEERRNLRKQWLKAVSEHGETMSLLDFAYGNLPHEGQLAAIERGVRWTTLSRKPFGLEQSSFPPWEPLLNLFVPPSGTNFSSARIQGLKTWLVLRTSSIQLFRNHNLK